MLPERYTEIKQNDNYRLLDRLNNYVRLAADALGINPAELKRKQLGKNLFDSLQIFCRYDVFALSDVMFFHRGYIDVAMAALSLMGEELGIVSFSKLRKKKLLKPNNTGLLIWNSVAGSRHGMEADPILFELVTVQKNDKESVILNDCTFAKLYPDYSLVFSKDHKPEERQFNLFQTSAVARTFATSNSLLQNQFFRI